MTTVEYLVFSISTQQYFILVLYSEVSTDKWNHCSKKKKNPNHSLNEFLSVFFEHFKHWNIKINFKTSNTGTPPTTTTMLWQTLVCFCQRKQVTPIQKWNKTHYNPPDPHWLTAPTWNKQTFLHALIWPVKIKPIQTRQSNYSAVLKCWLHDNNSEVNLYSDHNTCMHPNTFISLMKLVEPTCVCAALFFCTLIRCISPVQTLWSTMLTYNKHTLI